jgi:low affinity Fe/Cu permease
VFSDFAAQASRVLGSPWAFYAAAIFIVVWAALGPSYSYGNTWQLVLNVVTQVVPFLMVFVLQNSQNKDGRAIQLKLDELIASHTTARNRLIDLENCSEEEMDALREELLSRKASAERRHKAQYEPASAPEAEVHPQ